MEANYSYHREINKRQASKVGLSNDKWSDIKPILTGVLKRVFQLHGMLSQKVYSHLNGKETTDKPNDRRKTLDLQISQCNLFNEKKDDKMKHIRKKGRRHEDYNQHGLDQVTEKWALVKTSEI